MSEPRHAARRSVKIEIEPVAVGEGYVARLNVARGGAAVIVQPTWERLVAAIAESLQYHLGGEKT